MTKAKALPAANDLVAGYIIHDLDCGAWMVIGKEWDYFIGSDAWRIVQLATDESQIPTDMNGERLAKMPFSGRMAKLSPKSVMRYHTKESHA